MAHCPLYWFGPEKERAYAAQSDHCRADMGTDNPVPVPEAWATTWCKNGFPGCPTYAAVVQVREAEHWRRVLAERERVLGHQGAQPGSS